MGLRLRAFIDNQNTFHIHGNREGLEYLSGISLAIIGQPPGPNHYVIGPGFNADDDSLLFYVGYDQKLEESEESPS